MATITDQIREAVRESGLTKAELVRATHGEISNASLTRFVTNGEGAHSETLDRLAEVVGLRVVRKQD